MRVRKGIMATGVAIGLSSISFVTAGVASAQTPTEPAVSGVITGLHTFALNAGQTVVLGEFLRPETAGYFSYVPVTGIQTVKGVTTVTTGATFLPLNRAKVQTTFTVVQP